MTQPPMPRRRLPIGIQTFAKIRADDHYYVDKTDLTPEGATSLGRIDLTLKFNDAVWLFEFKVVESAPAGRALEQLKARGYADKYRALGQPIHLIGIEFSRTSRTLAGFEVETL